MKIIKKGNIPDEKIYQAKCHNCKTEVEFEQREGMITRDQRDGDFITVKCPLCGCAIHVAA